MRRSTIRLDNGRPGTYYLPMWRTRTALAVVVRDVGVVVLALSLFLNGTLRAQNDADQPTQVVPAPAPPPAESGTPSATTTLAPAAPNAQEPASSTYRLQPYDLIDLDVYSEADLHKPARLGSDGTVLLPLIGSVKIGGMTVAQATDLITKKYAAGFVKNPSVMITVIQYRKSTFSILGQVSRPGIYEIPEGAHVSILEAISLAGGYTTTAAQNAVMVKRMIDGKVTLYRIKAADMAQNPDVVPFEILPGDTVVVSAPEKASFTILGQVQRPGLFEIPPGTHVSIIEAISLAGGYTPMASQNGVTVKRMVDGRLVILPVRAADMEQDPNLVPFEVLAGDSVLVPYRNSTFSILGQVQKPGIYEIPEGAHVNIVEAILMAGGYTRTAAQNSVTVKRLSGGKLTTIKVHAGAMAQDPKLVPFDVLPGDIVKVNESWY
jgi:polysaccharide export outer membrane protein